MSDKTCGKCQHWQERNSEVGICTLNPRVWTGSWEYPAQFAIDTCSHWTPFPVSAPAPQVKGKKNAFPP